MMKVKDCISNGVVLRKGDEVSTLEGGTVFLDTGAAACMHVYYDKVEYEDLPEINLVNREWGLVV